MAFGTSCFLALTIAFPDFLCRKPLQLILFKCSQIWPFPNNHTVKLLAKSKKDHVTLQILLEANISSIKLKYKKVH